MNQHLGSLVGGTVGGALGTAFIQKGMQLSGKLPEPVRPPPPRQDPAEYILGRIASWRGRPLAPATHRRAAHGLHWVYGLGWSSLLGLLGPRLGMNRIERAAVAGAAFGAGVWAVGYLGWLPRAGIVERPRDSRIGPTVTNLLSHVGYGLLAALPIHLANRIACERM